MKKVKTKEEIKREKMNNLEHVTIYECIIPMSFGKTGFRVGEKVLKKDNYEDEDGRSLFCIVTDLFEMKGITILK